MADQMDEKMKASNFTKKRCEEILACRKACAQKGIECKRSSVEAIGAVMFLDGLEAGREGMRAELAEKDAKLERLEKASRLVFDWIQENGGGPIWSDSHAAELEKVLIELEAIKP